MAYETDSTPRLGETTTAGTEAGFLRDVNRPVQYLGSKLRVLPLLQDIIGRGGEASGFVWDAFTGSSVVAQAVAAAGNRVLASDTLLSSVTFAKAALGVDRNGFDNADAQLQLLLSESRNVDFPKGWKTFLDLEKELLVAGDGAALLRAGAALPQRWRNPLLAAPANLQDAFEAVDQAAERAMVSSAGLLSATYAGTYFGLKQALRLESLRAAIDELSEAEHISRWIRHVALTALCTAASSAVFSAGKHFAQPHRVVGDKDLTFHSRRVLSDRAVDIDVAFETAFRDIVRTSRSFGEGHNALLMGTDDATVHGLRERDVRTVYADPPYTAQQYSRFYHVLETLVTSTPPKLQRVRGEVTSGLYPEGRYKSAYCSRREAPRAFAHLIGTSASAGARLVLSYSGNAAGSRGNARTVSMESLVEMVRDAYGAPNVTVDRVNVKYRQFNRSSVEVAGRDDPEYVIVGESHAR